METGIEVYSESGDLIMNEESLNSRAVYKSSSEYFNWGSGGFNQLIMIPLPFAYMKTEIPVILVRPTQYDKYVGSTFFSTYWSPLGASFPNGNGGIAIQGQCPFDMIIFSTLGTPIQRAGAPMFEVYDGQGAVTFSDKYIFPRLRKLMQRAPTTGNQGWPMNADISGSGISGMPWFLAGPLFISGKGMGEFDENAGSTAMCIASDTKTVRVNYRYDGEPGNKQFYDPYANRPASFWVADVTGE